MLAALRALPLIWKIAGAAAIALGLWAGFELWKKSIYDAGFRAATEECKARAREQEREIQKVLDERRRDEDALVEELDALKREHENALERIMDDIRVTPGGDELCLTPERVRNLDAIR